MATRRERILRLLETMPGLTDREITDQLEGHSALQQPINALCRRMERQNITKRIKRRDGLIGNYLSKDAKTSKSIRSEQVLRKSAGSTSNAVEKHPESKALEKIISLGFEKVGKWYLQENSVTFDLHQHLRENDLLYAFIVDGQVKYIGKTTQELYRRIYLYKNCDPTQPTNIRVREKILESLKNSSQVLIYAFVPKTPLMFADIPINLAAGLEDNLIRRIDPEWNIL